MRRPRDPRSRKKQRPVAIIAAAALIVVVSVPYVALHLPHRKKIPDAADCCWKPQLELAEFSL